MKVSIVIAVLNSHEVVRRQLLHFGKMPLEDIELVLVDDGSSPPITSPGTTRVIVLYTNDKRPWTQGLARNLGASRTEGEYILFTDIDHILTEEALKASLDFTGDKMVFPRYYGILDEKGNIISDEKSMLEFGLDPLRVRTRRGYMCGGIHSNTYLIRRSFFNEIGGYDPRLCEQGFHMGGAFKSEEARFNSRYSMLAALGKVKPQVIGPKIYCYPVSKFRSDRDNNPFGLFHSLSLEQVPQPLKP